MRRGEPSKSALVMARQRAAHQVLDGGRVLSDPYACVMAGVDPAVIAKNGSDNRLEKGKRLGPVMRSRISEDALGRAVKSGVRQVVALGAGLETFGLRNPHANLGLKVFEVDHPDTQGWKRDHIAKWKEPPANLPIWVPVDLECDDMAGALAAAGFRRDQPAFFSLLGLLAYLERDTVRAILEFIGTIPQAQAVFDYMKPRGGLHSEAHDHFTRKLASLAEVGEPVLSQFSPQVMRRVLGEFGLAVEREFDFAGALAYFGKVVPASAGGTFHIVHAVAAAPKPPTDSATE